MIMTNGQRQLPPVPNPDNLRKQAKKRLSALRVRQPSTRLGEAQHLVAREYGFPSWAAMLTEVVRRQESPVARYRLIRKQSVAVPGGRSEEDAYPVQRLFLAGAGATTAFVIVACVGLALVILAIRQGMPFHGPTALSLPNHLR
jgi:hypothetical protein